MNRFFVSSEAISDRFVRLTQAQSHQLCHVLRLERGDAVLVLDNLGWEYDVRLERVDAKEASGVVVHRRRASGEPKTVLTLFQSLLTREKFEWVLQKGTELGVCRFVPMLTRRGLVRARQGGKKEKLERWRRILREAAEQSGRARIPVLEGPVPLRTALDGAGDRDLCLVATPHEGGVPLHRVLRQRAAETPVSIGLFVGPEGGFDPEEVELCLEAGAQAVRLGPRILRTETAAVVGAALVLYELGDLE